MYHPGDANTTAWAKYTKAFVDCKVKDADETGSHGTAFSVDNVYAKLINPNGKKSANCCAPSFEDDLYSAGVDIHHNVLQFLEEGAIDLVCIATDLVMDRCTTMRAKWGLADDSGTKCNCWMDAYKEMYGVTPTVDTTLTTCTSG